MNRESNDIDWIYELKNKVPAFLDRLRNVKKRGYSRYSLTGDLYTEKQNWGLGNTVFAARVYYTLDLLDNLPENELGDIINFIKSFQRRDGSIYDPLISPKTTLLAKLYALKNLDFSNGEKIRRAETRQSVSTLRLLRSRPDFPYVKLPHTLEGIGQYLEKLNWGEPYGAASHFSHLLFFLRVNNEMFCSPKASVELINYAIEWISKLQSAEDGSWYKGKVTSKTQKINGAMKVITGLKTVDKLNFKYPELLIDLCLSQDTYDQACNVLDVIYVLHYSNYLTRRSYRYNDIMNFCYTWLKTAKRHYFSDVGGFSFFPGRANQYYYGAKITRGLNEPDIHGTVLLLWGIALVSRLLGIDKELKFKEFVP
ncbi:MAG: hypothetical protein HYX96_03960 [Chloroflexi bacterium]|nr:hypothetical protein [Chloroflexota bacterium]